MTPPAVTNELRSNPEGSRPRPPRRATKRGPHGRAMVSRGRCGVVAPQMLGSSPGSASPPSRSATDAAVDAPRAMIRRNRSSARCWVTRTAPGVDPTASAVSSADTPTANRSTSTSRWRAGSTPAVELTTSAILASTSSSWRTTVPAPAGSRSSPPGRAGGRRPGRSEHRRRHRRGGHRPKGTHRGDLGRPCRRARGRRRQRRSER